MFGVIGLIVVNICFGDVEIDEDSGCLDVFKIYVRVILKGLEMIGYIGCVKWVYGVVFGLFGYGLLMEV